MSRLIIKIIILAAVAACVAPFFIQGPDGKTLMTLDDLVPEDPMPRQDATEEVITVYKWQDDDGVWHFSNDPADARGHEVVELDGPINTLAPIDVPPPEQKVPSAGMPAITDLSPVQVSQMMGTVTHLQETVDQRKTEIDQAISQ